MGIVNKIKEKGNIENHVPLSCITFEKKNLTVEQATAVQRNSISQSQLYPAQRVMMVKFHSHHW